ncbi:MAG: hypothetical protein AAFQ07_02315 [Chloroflexota bacterium]
MATPEQSTSTRPQVDMGDTAPSSFVQLTHWLIKHGWYLHPSQHFAVTLQSSDVYKLLEKSTKPNVKQLNLRKLFARGRRYFIRATQDGGFQMTMTSKVWWHPRRRTNATAILNTAVEEHDNGNTRLTMRGRTKSRNLLTALFYPTFMTSIIIYMPWQWWVILLSVLCLYATSWIGHRLSAKLEAYEIIHYIETVLADYTPEPPAQLAPQQNPEITVDESFTAEWDKYVKRTHND